MSTVNINPNSDQREETVNRLVYRFSRNWMLIFSLAFGIFVGLPFLSPVLMEIGWDRSGRAIYFIYTFFCHQLPQRSLFLFGEKTMYNLSEIQAAWQNTNNPLMLRQFVGNVEMGWKMAWSDRMVSMYTSILVFAWLWYPLRKRFKPLPWWGLFFFLIPIGIDGFTHMISDFAGIGFGFRDSNSWLAVLTNNAFPSTFYVGDALGSFNSWMRWISGIIFGLGVIWFGFPFLDTTFSSASARSMAKFQRADDGA